MGCLQEDTASPCVSDEHSNLQGNPEITSYPELTSACIRSLVSGLFINKHFRVDRQVGHVNFGSALLGNFPDLAQVLILGVTIERQEQDSGGADLMGLYKGCV